MEELDFGLCMGRVRGLKVVVVVVEVGQRGGGLGGGGRGEENHCENNSDGRGQITILTFCCVRDPFCVVV